MTDRPAAIAITRSSRGRSGLGRERNVLEFRHIPGCNICDQTATPDNRILQPAAHAGFIGKELRPEQGGEGPFLWRDLEHVYIDDVCGQKQEDNRT